MSIANNNIKVLVVDDSALMRKMIPMIISTDERIQVVGTAMDGEYALKKIESLQPDVITLDVDMPRMDGLAALKVIVRDFGIPVILVSSITKKGAATALKGLELGAFDFVTKPNDAISLHISEIACELIEKIKAAAGCRMPKIPKPSSAGFKQPQQKPVLPNSPAEIVVAVGISTGGPQALAEILPSIPGDFPAGIVIVQHMPEGFTEFFAKRLDASCQIRVAEAGNGSLISPGTAFIAPGGSHLRVKKSSFGLVTVLSKSPPVSGHRPSVSVLFNSVAEEIGRGAIGVIMTGMGDDGVEGLARIKANGGIALAQDEETSVIYGMPRVAVERGCVDTVLGLHDIVPEILNIVDRRSAKAASLLSA